MRRARVDANVRGEPSLAVARFSILFSMVDTLRARAIERLLPPLVHRLNNAVAVFQGVFELGARASARDREIAHRELAVLSSTLARLSLLARAPSTRPQVVALEQLTHSCTLLLRPLAQTLKVELEVQAQASLSTRCDAGLESLVLVTCHEFLVALHGQPLEARHLRLALSAVGDEARLVLVARGPLGMARAGSVLLDYARAHGLACAQRVSARGVGLRLTLPLLFERELVPGRARAAQRRVLLLQEPGQDRELAATLLREQGCDVREARAVPPEGNFELVLLDEDLLAHAPETLAQLGAHVRYARLARIRPPLRPAELIGLVAP